MASRLEQRIRMKITKEIIDAAERFLQGESGEGMRFFKECVTIHGQVDAVYMDNGIPHPVHFREGMQVRNLLRATKLCESWTDHDFDNNWVEVVQLVLDRAQHDTNVLKKVW